MFAGAGSAVERPVGWRSNSYHNATRSPVHSPTTSRNNSFSSITSAQTDPGLSPGVSRNSSTASATSHSSSKSGFRSLFGKKEKKPKKDVEKIVLTSKHAAAVKTKMMMDPRYKDIKPVKTAGITVSTNSGHSSAAQQEARHPHSGPPALHAKTEMPILTRIASGDEQDEEDEFTKMQRVRLEWELSKIPTVSRIREHESSESVDSSAEQSPDEGSMTPPSHDEPLSPGIEKALRGLDINRPPIVTKNSYGGRFHRDEKGHWKR